MSTAPIILVAYQCGPGMGSVSQLGWEWYQRLGREREVRLVTHARNRAALAGAGAPLANTTVQYVDTEWFAGPLYRLAKRLFPKSEHSVFLLSSLDYFVFDFAAYRALRRQLRAVHVAPDLIHRVTPVTISAPTWLGRLGLPLVVGPLNSGLSDPRGFRTIMREESTWLIRSRVLTRLFDAVVGSTRRADRILVASRATEASVGHRYRRNSRRMLENGVDLERFKASAWPEEPTATRPLRVLFTGRLVPVKGVNMLLQAVARVRASGQPIQLDVIGDGPLRSEWSALSIRLGLEHVVRFHGALAQNAVARHMRASHALCLPSVRESGGAVLLEAMACARPVIALDYGGPGEIVDAEVGALLPMMNPAQVIDDLTATLRGICADPAAWRKRGQTGRTRIEQKYSWPAKIDAARALYQEILAERSSSCTPA